MCIVSLVMRFSCDNDCDRMLTYLHIELGHNILVTRMRLPWPPLLSEGEGVRREQRGVVPVCGTSQSFFRRKRHQGWRQEASGFPVRSQSVHIL